MKLEHKTPIVISTELDASHAGGAAAIDETTNRWNQDEVEYYILILLNEIYKSLSIPPVVVTPPDKHQTENFKFQLPAGTYNKAALLALIAPLSAGYTDIHSLDLSTSDINTAPVSLELPAGNPLPILMGLNAHESACGESIPADQSYSPLRQDFSFTVGAGDTAICRVIATQTI